MKLIIDRIEPTIIDRGEHYLHYALIVRLLLSGLQRDYDNQTDRLYPSAS